MSVKVNENTIPDWAIGRQAEALFESVARGMPGKPREVIELAAFDLAKERMIDQALMAQESKRRNYQIDPAEVAKGMKQWLRQNGGKKAFQKQKHPVIKDQEDLKKEITSQIQFNRLLEEESCANPFPKRMPWSVTSQPGPFPDGRDFDGFSFAQEGKFGAGVRAAGTGGQCSTRED